MNRIKIFVVSLDIRSYNQWRSGNEIYEFNEYTSYSIRIKKSLNRLHETIRLDANSYLQRFQWTIVRYRSYWFYVGRRETNSMKKRNWHQSNVTLTVCSTLFRWPWRYPFMITFKKSLIWYQFSSFLTKKWSIRHDFYFWMLKRNTYSEIIVFLKKLTKFRRQLKRITATIDEILQYDYHRNKFEKRLFSSI